MISTKEVERKKRKICTSKWKIQNMSEMIPRIYALLFIN